MYNSVSISYEKTKWELNWKKSIRAINICIENHVQLAGKDEVLWWEAMSFSAFSSWAPKNFVPQCFSQPRALATKCYRVTLSWLGVLLCFNHNSIILYLKSLVQLYNYVWVGYPMLLFVFLMFIIKLTCKLWSIFVTLFKTNSFSMAAILSHVLQWIVWLLHLVSQHNRH